MYGLTGSINFLDFFDLFECSLLYIFPNHLSFSTESIYDILTYYHTHVKAFPSYDINYAHTKEQDLVIFSILNEILTKSMELNIKNLEVFSYPNNHDYYQMYKSLVYYVHHTNLIDFKPEMDELMWYHTKHLEVFPVDNIIDMNKIELADSYIQYLQNSNLPPLFDYSFVELGLTLILFSLFIKLALAPFHLWSLDVYEGSPTSSTVFFAVITKLSIFVILVRLCYISFFSVKDCWQFYSLWIGVFSIFVGSFGGLKQRKIKTLLAYSSTSHMGYSLIAFSTSTYMGIQMLLFYMIIYMISGLAIWSIFLLLKLKKNNSLGKYNKELGDLALLKKSNPTMAFALALTMFSIAGIPPMVGFLAKMSVFLSVIGITFYFVALISILFSVISTFYYIRLIKVLYFENLLVGKLYYPITTEKTTVLSVLVFSLIFLFLNPTLLYLFSYKVILSLI